MLSNEALERVLGRLQSRFDEVNSFYIRKIAEQIKKIGRLSQANINRLVIMADMTSDVREITERLMIVTRLNAQDIQAVYNAAMQQTYTDPRFTQAFTAGAQPSAAVQQRLMQYAQNISRQTAQTAQNLSNTTAIAAPYRRAVDRGILAVSTGLMDYQTATREIVREIGYNGLQVQYASGYHRRLDTAVRQNVVDGVKQITQHGANAIGEALEYREVEISAHMHSAPDHEPVQGRIFPKAEFDRMQAGLSCTDIDGHVYAGFKRPIAEWNCGHFARHSTPGMPNPATTLRSSTNGRRRTTRGATSTASITPPIRHSSLCARWKRGCGGIRTRRMPPALPGTIPCGASAKCASTQSPQSMNRLRSCPGLPMRKQRMSVEGFKMVKL